MINIHFVSLFVLVGATSLPILNLHTNNRCLLKKQYAKINNVKKNSETRTVNEFKSSTQRSKNLFNKMKQQLVFSNININLINLSKFNFITNYSEYNLNRQIINKSANETPEYKFETVNVGIGLISKITVNIDNTGRKNSALILNNNLKKLDFRIVNTASIDYKIVATGNKTNPNVNLLQTFRTRFNPVKQQSRRIGFFNVNNLNHNAKHFLNGRYGAIVLGIIFVIFITVLVSFLFNWKKFGWWKKSSPISNESTTSLISNESTTSFSFTNSPQNLTESPPFLVLEKQAAGTDDGTANYFWSRNKPHYQSEGNEVVEINNDADGENKQQNFVANYDKNNDHGGQFRSLFDDPDVRLQSSNSDLANSEMSSDELNNWDTISVRPDGEFTQSVNDKKFTKQYEENGIRYYEEHTKVLKEVRDSYEDQITGLNEQYAEQVAKLKSIQEENQAIIDERKATLANEQVSLQQQKEKYIQTAENVKIGNNEEYLKYKQSVIADEDSLTFLNFARNKFYSLEEEENKLAEISASWQNRLHELETQNLEFQQINTKVRAFEGIIDTTISVVNVSRLQAEQSLINTEQKLVEVELHANNNKIEEQLGVMANRQKQNSKILAKYWKSKRGCLEKFIRVYNNYYYSFKLGSSDIYSIDSMINL